MDVFNIGKRILGTPFALCSKPQEVRFQQHVKLRAWRPRLLSSWEGRKAARDQAGFLQRKLPSQLPSTSTDSLWPFKFYLSSIPSEKELFQTHGCK